MYLGDAAAQRGASLHLVEHVGQEKHLAVAGTGDQRVLRVAGVFNYKPVILDAALASHPFLIALPTLAVGRVAEHEVELARRKGVAGQRRMLRPADDVVGSIPFALEQQVGLADGVGFGVDLLAV